MKGLNWLCCLLAVGIGISCAPPERANPAAGNQALDEPPRSPGRTLTIALRFEPVDLAPKILAAGSGGTPKPLFNAALALVDNTGAARPHLAEALPQLNGAGWRVLPDGRMETIYRLRPNLTWHDGQPLAAEDFVFAWRVYTFPGLGVFLPTPQDAIEEVGATDLRTLTIRWRSPYAEAGALSEGKLDPLPRHVLGVAFAALEQDGGARDSFLNVSYWTNDYVGAGPFRLDRWEPGTQLEGVAFDGHVLGKPHIARIVIRIIADENTTLTNVISGTVQLAQYYTLRFEHAQVLRRDWVPAGRGVVLLDPNSRPLSIVQFRPEFQKTPALFDLRVRKALAHSMDKQALQDGLFEGEGVIAHSYVGPNEPYFPAVDRVIARYAYDPRRTEQLMAEAGFGKDREGFFADASGERFRPEFQAQSGSQFERHQAIMADTWGRAGIEVQPTILPASRSRDPQFRHTFSGLGHTVFGVLGEENFTTPQIGTAANRWTGANRGGWSSSEYDRLWDAYSTTLDPAGRNAHLVQMARIVSEEIPGLVLYYSFTVLAYVSELRGPTMPVAGSTNFWNAHEWELR